MLTTRIHAYWYAADPYAARDAPEIQIPCQIAAFERKFADSRRWNPEFGNVPSEIHTAALERMCVNVLREVEARLLSSEREAVTTGSLG
ncbi:hypothetical protein MFIFM68171_00162 [Madurella fahalii]|uniref:Uncharacterized protein n=1 Tax=Madurella fahalii TaxID=1157608 RepID=A0ABQ0FWR6_9PEZI